MVWTLNQVYQTPTTVIMNWAKKGINSFSSHICTVFFTVWCAEGMKSNFSFIIIFLKLNMVLWLKPLDLWLLWLCKHYLMQYITTPNPISRLHHSTKRTQFGKFKQKVISQINISKCWNVQLRRISDPPSCLF